MYAFAKSVKQFKRDHETWSMMPESQLFTGSPLDLSSTIQVDRGAHGMVCTDLQSAYKLIKLPRLRRNLIDNSAHTHAHRAAFHEAILMNCMQCEYILSVKSTHLIVKRGHLRGLVYQMELADHNIIRMRRTITLSQMHTMIRHMTLALVYLHCRGIVHGDIKPANVLCFGNVFKLCDFSISILTQMKCSRPLASYYYRPPEVFMNGRFTFAGDVWSFAVLILDCLFGAVFFRDIYSIDEDPVQRLRDFRLADFVNPTLPIYLFLDKALVLDPALRASSVTLARDAYVDIDVHDFDSVVQFQVPTIDWIYTSAVVSLEPKMKEMAQMGWDTTSMPLVLKQVLDFIFRGRVCSYLESKLFHICQLLEFKLFSLEWKPSGP